MSYFNRHMVRLQKENPYREPAGAPEGKGGQYARKPAGASGDDPIGEEAGGGTYAPQLDSSTPAAGKTSHDTVPAEITSFIEDFVSRQEVTFRGRHAAADLMDALSKNYGKELEDLIDNIDPSQRPTVLLHKGDEAKGVPTTWLLGWSEQQGTDIHDHLDSEVGIHVLRGVVTERVYSCPRGCTAPRETAKNAKEEGIPVNEHERDLRAGSSIGLKAPYVHEVFGTAKDAKKRDITVHGYYPPLDTMTYYKYDSAKGRLIYDGEWTEGVEPSPEEKQKKRKRDRCCSF